MESVQKATPSKASAESAKEAEVGDDNFSNASSDENDSTADKKLLNAVQDIICDSSDAGATLGNLASAMESSVSPSEIIEVSTQSFPTVSERNIYVTFPFIGGIAVNEASVDLSLCNVGADYTLSLSTVMAIQDVFVTQRKKCVEILVQDLDRLNPGQWFNDNLIEFWFLWLMRNENLDTTDVMMTSTYFYHTLIEKGVHAVDRWFVDDDIFNKKYIMVPINSDNHWSLAVIINPGKIDVDSDDTEEFPCIVMLDSLESYHNKQAIVKWLHMWLNYEWKKIHEGDRNMFNGLTMRVINPKGNYAITLH